MPGMKRIPLERIPALAAKFSVKYAAIIAIGVSTGCRISEILSLRRGDLIDGETGQLREVIAFLKLKSKRGAKTRNMSIPANLRRFIVTHLNAEAKRGFTRPDDPVFRGQKGQGLSRFSVYDKFRTILGAGYGTHWMRKTFAWEMFQYFLKSRPGDFMRALELTRQALGHERIDTTIKYLGIEQLEMIEAQNEVFGKL